MSHEGSNLIDENKIHTEQTIYFLSPYAKINLLKLTF
jgi:hypothetical protein